MRPAIGVCVIDKRFGEVANAGVEISARHGFFRKLNEAVVNDSGSATGAPESYCNYYFHIGWKSFDFGKIRAGSIMSSAWEASGCSNRKIGNTVDENIAYADYCRAIFAFAFYIKDSDNGIGGTGFDCGLDSFAIGSFCEPVFPKIDFVASAFKANDFFSQSSAAPARATRPLGDFSTPEKNLPEHFLGDLKENFFFVSMNSENPRLRNKVLGDYIIVFF